MRPPTPRCTRTDTLFPYTTLFRSKDATADQRAFVAILHQIEAEIGPAPPPAPRNDQFARAGGVVQQDQSANDDLVKQHFGGAANMGVHGPGRAIADQHAYGTGKGGKLIPIAAPIARRRAKGRSLSMGRPN